MLIKAEYYFDKFANAIGHVCGVIMLVMMLNVFYNVVMRYFFRSGSIGMQELEWHFFSLIILLGISYALKEDGHVRVDVIYDRLQPKKQALINLVGAVLFLLPVSLLIATGSTEFVLESYRSGEASGDPGGLPYRWLIKGLIPLSFYLLLLVNVGFIIKNINRYRGHSAPERES